MSSEAVEVVKMFWRVVRVVKVPVFYPDSAISKTLDKKIATVVSAPDRAGAVKMAKFGPGAEVFGPFSNPLRAACSTLASGCGRPA